jgi:hypothetical protein
MDRETLHELGSKSTRPSPRFVPIGCAWLLIEFEIIFFAACAEALEGKQSLKIIIIEVKQEIKSRP